MMLVSADNAWRQETRCETDLGEADLGEADLSRAKNPGRSDRR